MRSLKKRKKLIKACVSAIASTAHVLNCNSVNSSRAISLVSSMVKKNKKPQGRYIVKGGSIPTPMESLWGRIRRNGDDLEFFHFTGFTKDAFYELVSLLETYVERYVLIDGRLVLKKKKWKKFDAVDCVAMGIKYLISTAEIKDLHPQFGASASTFSQYVNHILHSIVMVLVNHEKSKVF